MLKETYYKNIVDEVKLYSNVIYYLVLENKLSLQDVKQIFYQDNIEKCTLFYLKTIKAITNEDMDNALKLAINEHEPKSCIEEILDFSKQEFSHLKTILGLALNNEESKKIIHQEDYLEYLQIKSLKKLLALTKDNNLTHQEHYKKYLSVIKKLEKQNYQAFEKNINNYYLKKFVNVEG